MNWYLNALKNYAVFKGRARRTEFWVFQLSNAVILMFLAAMDEAHGSAGVGPFSGLFALVVVIPSVAVSARRLHDTDRSGWWQILSFVPLIGAIVLFVFLVQDSTPGENQYGPNPKDPTPAAPDTEL